MYFHSALWTYKSCWAPVISGQSQCSILMCGKRLFCFEFKSYGMSYPNAFQAWEDTNISENLYLCYNFERILKDRAFTYSDFHLRLTICLKCRAFNLAVIVMVMVMVFPKNGQYNDAQRTSTDKALTAGNRTQRKPPHPLLYFPHLQSPNREGWYFNGCSSERELEPPATKTTNTATIINKYGKKIEDGSCGYGICGFSISFHFYCFRLSILARNGWKIKGS